MTETPESPGVETAVAKPIVAAVQGALDATFNGRADASPDQVQARLRAELDLAGVAEELSADQVRTMAETISRGEPVAAEPDEPAP